MGMGTEACGFGRLLWVFLRLICQPDSPEDGSREQLNWPIFLGEITKNGDPETDDDYAD